MAHINTYAGRSHDEAYAARKGKKQAAQEQAGGAMAVEGSEADDQHSSGQLSEKGKQVWRTGSGLDGGGMDNGGRDIPAGSAAKTKRNK
ncbi:hypothetical protein [Pararobbsia alpina]|uniref:Uncharacterized protein n=1 Tax=Pararobbsia alpina TaxID=621374 RepID=A0A6S7B697_9BURK|nr:hypothetical protein [Pararobbsia alpina]CAB3787143.1 hypothetical protein LMG28138_02373 [Pararobbsia alpina]